MKENGLQPRTGNSQDTQSNYKVSFDPRWAELLLVFIVGLGAFAYGYFHWKSLGLGLALAAVPVVGSLIGGFQRIFFRRYLEMEGEALSIPSGFLHRKLTRILYREIDDLWENGIGQPVLVMRIKDRKVTIPSGRLPDKAAFEKVRDFVKARVATHKPRVMPSSAGMAGGYQFRWVSTKNGEICDCNGQILWSLRSKHAGSAYGLCGPFRMRDVELSKPGGEVCCTANWERKWPLGGVNLLENGSPAGFIRIRGPLLRRYLLELPNTRKWEIREPGLKSNSVVISNWGEELKIKVWSPNAWDVSVDPKADEMGLTVTLAFIQAYQFRFRSFGQA